MATIKEQHDAWVKQIPATETIDPAPPAATPPAAAAVTPPAADDSDPAAPVGDTSGDSVDPPPTPAEADGVTDPPEGADDAPPKGSARERIEGLIDERNALRDFAKLQQENNRLLTEQLGRVKPTSETPAPATVTTPTAVASKPPRMDDPAISFDPDKFAEAQAKWIKEQVKAGVEEGLAKSRTDDSAAAAANEGKRIATTYADRTAEFKKTHTDWDTLATQPGLLEPHPVAGREIQQSEVGPQITYHIMKDKDFRAKLVAASPEKQLKMIGVLEDKLVAEKAAGGTPPAAKPPVTQKRTTQAPPPPTRIPSGGGTDTREETDPNLPMDDFVRRHRAKATAAREAKRARR